MEVFEHEFEGFCSKMVQLLLQYQKIELAVSEDKIEEEISQTLEYTDDLMGQRTRLQNSFELRKLKLSMNPRK